MKKQTSPARTTKTVHPAAPKAFAVETDHAAMLFELERSGAGDRLYLHYLCRQL